MRPEEVEDAIACVGLPKEEPCAVAFGRVPRPLRTAELERNAASARASDIAAAVHVGALPPRALWWRPLRKPAASPEAEGTTRTPCA